ncbi:MAG: hypothetical protein ABJF88_10205 [Rhodothermales bacterium]
MPLLSYVLLLGLTVAACARVPEPGASEDPPAPSAETETPAEMSHSEPDPAEPSTAPATRASSPPTLTTFREGDGATANLTFRSDTGVAVSGDAPLLLVVDGDTLTVPLTAGPARFTEPEGAVVDQASYHLDADAFRTLVNARADAVTVHVSQGDGYTSYPYLSGDTIE